MTAEESLIQEIAGGVEIVVGFLVMFATGGYGVQTGAFIMADGAIVFSEGQNGEKVRPFEYFTIFFVNPHIDIPESDIDYHKEYTVTKHILFVLLGCIVFLIMFLWILPILGEEPILYRISSSLSIGILVLIIVALIVLSIHFIQKGKQAVDTEIKQQNLFSGIVLLAGILLLIIGCVIIILAWSYIINGLET